MRTMLTMLFLINQNTKDLIILRTEQLVNCHVKTLWRTLMKVLCSCLVRFAVDALFRSILKAQRNKNMNYFSVDIECEPPPEPAPSETMHPSHRDISIASMNAYSMKPPSSSFVLKIDKNGDQIHEEFIPKNQHGESLISILSFLQHRPFCECFTMMQQAVASNNHCHTSMEWKFLFKSHLYGFFPPSSTFVHVLMCRHLLEFLSFTHYLSPSRLYVPLYRRQLPPFLLICYVETLSLSF